MSYAALDTRMPQGWRTPPLGLGREFARQNTLGQFIGPELPPDYSPYTEADAENEAAWYDVLGQLQEANQSLRALEEEIRVNPEIAAALGRDIIAQRNALTPLVSEFQYWWALVFPEPAPGISGFLGGTPLLVTGAAAAFVLLASGLVLWWRQQNILLAEKENVRINTARKAQSVSEERTQAREYADLSAAARANGDIASAEMYEKLSAESLRRLGEEDEKEGSKDWLQFFEKNTKWIGLGLGILVLAPPLLQAVLPRRR